MTFWQWAIIVGEMTAILGAFLLVRFAIYLRHLAELEKEMRERREQIEREREEYRKAMVAGAEATREKVRGIR